MRHIIFACVAAAAVSLSPRAEAGPVTLSVELTDDVTWCDADGFLDPDEVGTLRVRVENGSEARLERPAVNVSSKAPVVSFPFGIRHELPPIEPGKSQEARFRVALEQPLQASLLPLSLVVEDPAFEGPVRFELELPAQLDQVEQRSWTDDVELAPSVWRVRSDDRLSYPARWSRSVTPGANTVWRVAGRPGGADSTLTSPVMRLSREAPFRLAFSHRLRAAADDQGFLEGGVVEVSLDDGAWVDAAWLSDLAYDGELGRVEGHEDRPAFGVAPEEGFSRVHLNLGMLDAEEVRVRFRYLASAETEASNGWSMDDIEVLGVVMPPFPALVKHRAACLPEDPPSGEPPEWRVPELVVFDPPPLDASGLVPDLSPASAPEGLSWPLDARYAGDIEVRVDSLRPVRVEGRSPQGGQVVGGCVSTGGQAPTWALALALLFGASVLMRRATVRATRRRR